MIGSGDGRDVRKHLLIPIAPTANGRLHLGHIGGPILKMDVLARHLARRGDQVRLVGGTDPYDSFVPLRAEADGLSPQEVVAYWHGRIERDLRAVGIAPDCFADLLTEPWGPVYREVQLAVMRDLTEHGLVITRRDKFLYSPVSGEYVTGGWLLGSCPGCGSATAGYFCEQCAMHFPPERVIEPRSRRDIGPLEWREVPCLHLRLRAAEQLRHRLAEMGVPAGFRQVIDSHLAASGPLLRLTHPGSWGVPWPVPGSPDRQVIFTYCVGGLGFWLACAHIAGEIDPAFADALHTDSAVRSVASFGFDNTVPFLLGGVGMAMELPALKPVDHVLLNHFMNLDGSKFSTSRGHVIWGSDLVSEPGVDSDSVRAYLTSLPAEREVTNFSRQEFRLFRMRVLDGSWAAGVRSAWPDRATSVQAPPGRLVARLDELLARQENALDPADHHPAALLDTLHAWIADQSGVTSAYWWLKGFALLAEPVLPAHSARLWQLLGAAGRPTVDEFLTPTTPVDGEPPVPGRAAEPVQANLEM
jgi:methionyl-tRNA synthetase